jgi:hypothetical protein
MKKVSNLMALLVAALLITGCSLVPLNRDIQVVNPSNVIITEERPVSRFTGIDFSTFGKVTITQGASESLTITGSDNVVPLVISSISNDTLILRTKENINILSLSTDNVLTFEIIVKDLAQLTNSGAGQLNMEQLTTDSLEVTVSGMGDISLAGKAHTAKIDISGAGSVKAPDLRISEADITISGVGTAEIWVTDQLTGDISGAGIVRYYGFPQVDTDTTGLGKFVPRGNN